MPRRTRALGNRIGTLDRCVGLLTLAAALIGPVPALGQTPPPTAAAGTLPGGAPQTLHLLRSYQVWTDQLPPTLDPAAVEVVLLSPQERCHPPVKILLGMRMASGDPMALALCKRIDSFIAKPPLPLPIATRAAPQAGSSRSVSDTAAALAPAPTRRYLALVRWDHSMRADLQWHFEEAVFDRQDQRWIWHAARGYDVSTHRDWRERSEVETLTSYLVHDLPSDLLNRGWWRSDPPVPDSRWVPPAEIAGWQPGARAALALANTYAGSMPLSEYRRLQIRPTDAADQPDVRPADPSERRPRQRAQRTPLLPPATHALLDLPPGDYLVRVYDEAPERISLAPGQTLVINIHRAAVFTGTARTFEDAAWWQARLQGQRSRHAFLAEPASRGAVDLVPFFLTP